MNMQERFISLHANKNRQREYQIVFTIVFRLNEQYDTKENRM
jgi:hypothetical protein